MGEQLCQICRTSGVRVSFDSTNTRDSFYRASVDFVLNVCRRAPTHCTSVQIDGEDAWKFVAGLAENICAAIIVSAAVAARTRSRKSSVNVLDAKTMSADPVAVVEIPHRVPPGFHAFFVTECRTATENRLRKHRLGNNYIGDLLPLTELAVTDAKDIPGIWVSHAGKEEEEVSCFVLGRQTEMGLGLKVWTCLALTGLNGAVDLK
ncbi:carotenoid 9 [Quercus suber]|uniref:Carotenoid 9 n=1 Tax=Quercus suber TaxID=58331 RepID=A0AAW0MCB2_QUESU